MRLLICGDRNWNNEGLIYSLLSITHENQPVDMVIHGGCRGADVMGGRAAEQLGIPVTVFPALWDRYGKSAGPRRNQQMLEDGKPDVVWAFHDDLENSRGTRHMVSIARRAGVPVRVWKNY